MSYSGWSNNEFHSIYNDGTWNVVDFCPVIKPIYSGVQYAQSVIEGMKAYKDKDNIIIFRIEDHHKRLNFSLSKLNLPLIDFGFFYKSLKSIISSDSQWLEPIQSDVLYIRPIVYGLEGEIFPQPAKKYGFSIYTAPVGSFSKEKCSIRFFDNITRTSPNGLSAAKVSTSYLPIISKVEKDGNYTDVWFDPISGIIEEADTANIFFITSDNTVITPELNNRILSGITRDSIIQIINTLDDYKVIEKKIKVSEINELLANGKLKGCFMTSTGIGLQQVDSILVDDKAKNLHNDLELFEKLKTIYTASIFGNFKYFKKWSHIL